MEDLTISVHHAELKYNHLDQSWQIKDRGRYGRGSSNGIWLRIRYFPISKFNDQSTFRIGIYIYVINIL